MTDARVFFYVDGIPTKGMWLDMYSFTDWDEIRGALSAAKLCSDDYGGDILAADAEGLAKCFLSRYGTFDMDAFVSFVSELRDDEHAAAAAYIDHVGAQYATPENFRDAFRGEYPSMADYAEELTRECYGEIPEHLDHFIDWEAMGRDMEMNDYFSVDTDGGVFVFTNS